MKRLTRMAIALTAAALLSQPAMAQVRSLSQYDQIKSAVQKICPVSGKPLDSMGGPLKVRIGEEEIFLCCKGCTKGQVNKEHWTAIHENFAKAQAICPVMEKALPANPKSTVVNGQTVYICCPPCTKRIKADPKKYITMVAGYYQVALKETRNQRTAQPGQAKAGQAKAGHVDGTASTASPFNRDQLRAAIQNICPVSGKPLGSMGSPIKVRAGEMDLFLCCEGCREGKVKKEHWATIRGTSRRLKEFALSWKRRCPQSQSLRSLMVSSFSSVARRAPRRSKLLPKSSLIKSMRTTQPKRSGRRRRSGRQSTRASPISNLGKGRRVSETEIQKRGVAWIPLRDNVST